MLSNEIGPAIVGLGVLLLVIFVVNEWNNKRLRKRNRVYKVRKQKR